MSTTTTTGMLITVEAEYPHGRIETIARFKYLGDAVTIARHFAILSACSDRDPIRYAVRDDGRLFARYHGEDRIA